MQIGEVLTFETERALNRSGRVIEDDIVTEEGGEGIADAHELGAGDRIARSRGQQAGRQIADNCATGTAQCDPPAIAGVIENRRILQLTDKPGLIGHTQIQRGNRSGIACDAQVEVVYRKRLCIDASTHRRDCAGIGVRQRIHARNCYRVRADQRIKRGNVRHKSRDPPVEHGNGTGLHGGKRIEIGYQPGIGGHAEIDRSDVACLKRNARIQAGNVRHDTGQTAIDRSNRIGLQRSLRAQIGNRDRIDADPAIQRDNFARLQRGPRIEIGNQTGIRYQPSIELVAYSAHLSNRSRVGQRRACGHICDLARHARLSDRELTKGVLHIGKPDGRIAGESPARRLRIRADRDTVGHAGGRIRTKRDAAAGARRCDRVVAQRNGINFACGRHRAFKAKSGDLIAADRDSGRRIEC